MRKISLCISNKDYALIKVEEGVIEKYVSLINPALGFHSAFTLVTDMDNATCFDLIEANEFMQDHLEELSKSNMIPSYFVVSDIFNGKFLKIVHGKKGDIRVRWTSDFERVTKFATVIEALSTISKGKIDDSRISISEVRTYLDEMYTPAIDDADNDWEFK